MKFPFQERDLMVGVIAFVLGIAFTMAFQKWNKSKEGWRNQVVPVRPHSSLPVMFSPQSPREFRNSFHRTMRGFHPHIDILIKVAEMQGFRNIAAVKVITTPGSWANHAQIETTQLNEKLNHGYVYQFPPHTKGYGSLHKINHINPSAGPGTHLNGGNATNIVYNGYVFVAFN